MGIHSWVLERDGGFAVLVRNESVAMARMHIAALACEDAQSAPLPSVTAVRHPHAWLGSVAYAIVLMAVGYAAGINLFGNDWFESGSLNGRVLLSHQWWRIVTALTLHMDVAHLVGNLVFGVVLGYFVSVAVGAGIGWASIMLAAAMGNALDAWWMPEPHRSIGASTAVFAALGLLSAYAWRRNAAASTRLGRLKRWAPLVAGIMLLGLIGVGGENTDVIAHATGFASGGLLGAGLARTTAERLLNPAMQIGAAALTVLVIAGAWFWGLSQ